MIGHFGTVLASAFALAWSEAPAQELPPAPKQSETQATATARVGPHQTADPARTRAAIEEVLARPEFADLHGDPDALWRQLTEWLLSLLARGSSALANLAPWLCWLIVGWMLLTLAAILAHLLYTLWRLLGGSRWATEGGPSARRHRGELLGIPDLDFETVYAEALRLLATGDWLAATKYYYVTAILWLDRQGAIVFRPPKTNRDYIAELRDRVELQGLFRRLTNGFESIIYGGRAATAATSHDMADIVKGLLDEPLRTAAN
jgi:hypothetical protein